MERGIPPGEITYKIKREYIIKFRNKGTIEKYKFEYLDVGPKGHSGVGSRKLNITAKMSAWSIQINLAVLQLWCQSKSGFGKNGEWKGSRVPTGTEKQWHKADQLH